jgi:hypothetical protein
LGGSDPPGSVPGGDAKNRGDGYGYGVLINPKKKAFLISSFSSWAD